MTDSPELPARKAATPAADALLTRDVIAHLAAQLTSARTLLAVVLEQGKAIRARNVQGVVRYAGELQAELQRRRQIEQDRFHLLQRAGGRLGVSSGAVTVELLTALMDPPSAQLARSRSAELRGMLGEVQREHIVNRTLMSQHLAFLHHLLRLVDIGDSGAYGSAASPPSSQAGPTIGARRILDMTA
jgi:hypothetical protein